MGKGMQGGENCGKRDKGGDCGERDLGELTVRKRLRGGDCGERDAGRGLWGKGGGELTVGKEGGGGCREGTVEKGMRRELWEKG